MILCFMIGCMVACVAEIMCMWHVSCSPSSLNYCALTGGWGDAYSYHTNLPVMHVPKKDQYLFVGACPPPDPYKLNL
jgi:hypothetical protein